MLSRSDHLVRSAMVPEGRGGSSADSNVPAHGLTSTTVHHPLTTVSATRAG
ncbi:hypothetical protein [Streptosporangium sp. NPDC048865]|uniref:hypothetical protein n=1 Tax=Streptosporangium sp. NPDC048865 TaxID=3155766 RepID=UPI00343DCA94